jgi:hypothetical protein
MNNTHNIDHVNKSLDDIRLIFDKASSIIEGLKPGEKIPATKLADLVASNFDMTGIYLYHTLKFLLKNYPGVKISAGRHGGIEKL